MRFDRKLPPVTGARARIEKAIALALAEVGADVTTAETVSRASRLSMSLMCLIAPVRVCANSVNRP
jgi:NAD(P)-dependent dehydrogenase (short-subunit alcohol dehydrogenase family)